MQKKNFLIAPILFLNYEESVCPLLLKYNKVYFVSPLIAKPNMYGYLLGLVSTYFNKYYYSFTCCKTQTL